MNESRFRRMNECRCWQTINERNVSLCQTYKSCWFHRSNECYVVLNKWILILFCFGTGGLLFFNFNFLALVFCHLGTLFFLFLPRNFFLSEKRRQHLTRCFGLHSIVVAHIQFFQLDFWVIPWWSQCTHHLCLFSWALFPSYLGVECLTICGWEPLKIRPLE